MRKLVTLGLGVALAASFATAAFAGPSRSIVQELGSVVKQGEVNIDIAGLSTANNVAPLGAPVLGLAAYQLGLQKTFQVNVGAYGGEFRVSNNSVGYKAAFSPNLAGYGEFGYTNNSVTPAGGVATTAGTTALKAGIAYTASMNGFLLNINPEFVSISNTPVGVATTGGFNVNAAALYPVNPNWIIGGELLYSTLNYPAPAAGNITGATTIALGARYIPSANVTFDVALFANTSASVDNGAGVTSTTTLSAIGVPVVAKLNIAF